MSPDIIELRTELVKQITGGLLDQHLELISSAIQMRKAVLGTANHTDIFTPPSTKKPVHYFKIGDPVVFNKRARPKYLQGQKAKIVGHKTVNVVIELDSPNYRFGGRITCPTGIIDKA